MEDKKILLDRLVGLKTQVKNTSLSIEKQLLGLELLVKEIISLESKLEKLNESNSGD